MLDPKQAVLDAYIAMKFGDTQMADERLAAYWRWRSQGGFEPKVFGEPGDEVARKVC